MRIYLESSIGCSREKKERFIRLVDALYGIYTRLYFVHPTGGRLERDLGLYFVHPPSIHCRQLSQHVSVYLLCLSVAIPVEFGLLICNCIKRLFETCLFIERERLCARIDLILVIHKYKTWDHFLFTFTSFDWMVWYSEEFFHKNEVQWSETELTDMICPRLKALVDFYRTEISNWYNTLNIHVIYE